MSERTHFPRRLVASVAAAGLLLMGLATTASADTAPLDPTSPASPPTVAADALGAPQIDGVVWSQAIVGDTVYVAGKFTTARPAGSPAGTNTVPRSNLLAFSISTGQLLPWAPVTDGQVRAITRSPDGSRIYITGDFNKVDGVFHVRIAAFNTSNNTIVAGFKPTLASSGLAIAASNTTVYAGGNFTSAASTTGGTLVPRKYVAAFNASTGALTNFVADANDAVSALAVTPDLQRVVVGGRFTSLSGSNFYGLGSVDPTTGAPVSFPANAQIRNAGAQSGITSLYADASGIYGTGYHFGTGGNDEGSFRISATTGELLWVADCHGDTYSAFPVGNVVYVASHHHYCGNMDGFPQTEPWTTYHANAFSLAATGVNKPDIYGYPDHAGQPSPTLLNFYPNFYTGSYTGQGQAAWSVTGNSDYIVYGGEFPGVNGGAQYGLVRFAISSKAPNKQGPMLTGNNWLPSVASHVKGQVRISYSSNWDRDNETLTYKLYRGSENTTPLQTSTITTPFWKPQTTLFTDKTAPPGTTQQYRVTATDAFGNVARSSWVTVTVNATDELSPYANAVLDDGAGSYWRLGDASGNFEDWAGGAPSVPGSGVGRGAPGAIGGDTDQAATFNGTNTGFAATQNPIEGPQTFSIETWIKTTTTAGGKIVGFGNANTGQSSNYDRHVYMDNAGRLLFGVYPGDSRTIQSSKAYNDGQWHQVVATLSSAGMKLYVDGTRVAQRADTTSAQSYSGYWRIGGDTPWTAAAFFNGSIDETAIYPGALTAAQVDDHWVKSGRTSTIPAAPADAYGAAVFGLSPDVYWRLGEASGTTAADSGPAKADATYVGTVTRGVTGALTGVSNTAVSFSGSSNNLVASKSTYTNPTVYSEELWFKTTTTNGGKLIGFGDQPSGTSGSYDRHVYMENDGRLTFGVWTGQTNTITTPAAYNNGAWHHLVATQSSAGMKLYVDGVLRGTNPQTQAQGYTGYWRVGGDTTWGPQPWFAGSIDEVAVYSDALTQAQVLQHFQLGTNTVPNVAPTAAFSTDVTDLKVDVDASASTDQDGTIASYAWSFDDGGTATGKTASHTFTTAGDHTVTLVVTDDDGDTGTVQHTVTTVAPNQAPTAAFSSSVADLKVSVDASASDDSDGTIASYAWTFGDGSTATGKTASHTYASADTYTVKLVVTDDDGATATVSHDVTVTDPPNVAPTASFTATMGPDGRTVSVNAAASNDPDGTISSYAWSFGPSGSGTGVTSSYTFPADGTYTVTLTVTDNRGGTDSTSKTVTALAPTGPVPLATDAFGRTSSSGWGAADLGGTWGLSGAASLFTVQGGSGLVSVAAGATPRARLAINARDVDISTSVSLNKLSDAGVARAYLAARTVGTTNDYYISVKVAANGGLSLQFVRRIAGVDTNLTAVSLPGVTYVAGQKLNIRLQAQGANSTTLRAKAWLASQAEPTAWQLTATDSTADLQVAGGVGIGAYSPASTTNGPLTFSWDDFAVTALP
ncbi:PKD domain-containing protein [Cellulomonas edaphi]|uniref:PKD domain-containing protein n=1 Tax=Cellulomonas edaphi TaxID=3053468 RepID=A0ABT7S4Z3_9CELL|nr:PKD domain-containing protein [Cellulomons edaphi]MDM7830695.1 PKD domain-containing protein [Cellulomons edaphi]